MAGEFTKRVASNSQTIWTCTSCNEDIACSSKPRGHMCGSGPPGTPLGTSHTPHARGGGRTTTPRMPPPPGSLPSPFLVPPPSHDHQQQQELHAILRAQMLQAEQQQQQMTR